MGKRAETKGRRPWGRPLLIAALILLCAIPIAVGAVIVTGSNGETPATFTLARPSRPVAPLPAVRAAAPAGALVALLRHPTLMRHSPGGAPLTPLSTRTEFGSPEALWVIKRTNGWLGVVSTLAGNGKLGWIPQGAASLSRLQWELKVSLSARKLTVFDHGKVIKRYTVAIGQQASPTPTGRFAVTDRLLTHDPAGPYGCCILALSAHSPHAIQGWTGGDRIAIHSTPDVAGIGEAVSHGCLRLTLGEGRWLISHVPLGTPTVIRS